MKNSKQIAQWVIDNRYPKSENEKVSDLEMYFEIATSIDELRYKETLRKAYELGRTDSKISERDGKYYDTFDQWYGNG